MKTLLTLLCGMLLLTACNENVDVRNERLDAMITDRYYDTFVQHDISAIANHWSRPLVGRRCAIVVNAGQVQFSRIQGGCYHYYTVRRLQNRLEVRLIDFPAQTTVSVSLVAERIGESLDSTIEEIVTRRANLDTWR